MQQDLTAGVTSIKDIFPVDENGEMKQFVPPTKTTEDMLLPANLIEKAMIKAADNPRIKFSKKARTGMQLCVKDFIGFVTMDAGQRIEVLKRRTMNGEDIIDSMQCLEFKYVDVLKKYLNLYRFVKKGSLKGATKRGRKRKGPPKESKESKEANKQETNSPEKTSSQKKVKVTE